MTVRENKAVRNTGAAPTWADSTISASSMVICAETEGTNIINVATACLKKT